MRVKEIMKMVVSIGAEKTLLEAARLMASKGIGCLIVSSGDNIKGIITERDILKCISKDQKCLDLKVTEVMSKQVITIESSKDLEFAAELMSAKKIKKLPVIEKERLVGIITSTDLVANADELTENSLF